MNEKQSVEVLREEVCSAYENCTDEDAADFLAQVLDHWPKPPLITDGYHSFGELYSHRGLLFVAFMKSLNAVLREKGFDNHRVLWWSRNHEKGGDPMFPGMIVAGINLDSGDITYHLEETYVDLLKRAKIPELAYAPEWDGHTSDDVLERLEEWL